MKETVDKILRQEEDARKRIEQARQEAQALVRKAQDDADRKIQEALNQAHSAAEKYRLESEKSFVQEKEKELKLTLEDISARMIHKDKDIPELSRRIFQNLIRIKG